MCEEIRSKKADITYSVQNKRVCMLVHLTGIVEVHGWTLIILNKVSRGLSSGFLV